MFYAVNPNGVKRPLANGCITFFINGKLTFINGSRSLPMNPPDYVILDTSVFDNFILADKLSVKVLRRFATYVLASNSLYEKLLSSLEILIILDDNLRATPVSYFVADFSSLSSKSDNFTFTLLYWVILH